MSSKARNRYLIDPRVQFSIVRTIVFHWAIFIALFLCIVLTVELFIRETNVTIAECIGAAIEKNSLLLILFVASMPAFLYDTIKLSHRFAGPVSRLKQGLSSLAKGDKVDEMKFRKGDYWGELADDFNRVAQRLQDDSKPNQQEPA